MQSRQGSTHQSLRDANGILIDHADRLGDIPNCGAARQLSACLVKIDEHDNQQRSRGLFAQSSSHRANSLRRVVLRNHMAPIARVAAVALPRTEELKPLRLPRGGVSFSNVVSAARGMATVAKTREDIFIAAGLAPDFIAQLVSATDALQASLDARGKSRHLKKGATVGIGTTIREARQAVRVLDSLVRIALEDDPALLTAWNAARTIRRPSAKPSAAPVEVATPAVDITPVAVVTAAA